MTSVYVVNGPNLNLLGSRKPEVYGSTTAAQLEVLCRQEAAALGLELVFRQTNHEGQLVDWLQEIGAEAAAGRSVGVVLNPGAYAHTSVAIRDAIESANTPVVECHISNVHAREAFRHHSYVSSVALAVLAGFGVNGYCLAMRGLVERTRPN